MTRFQGMEGAKANGDGERNQNNPHSPLFRRHQFRKRILWRRLSIGL